jgi:transaldolase
MPRQTLDSFAEHGNVERALDTDRSEPARILAQAADSGVDLATVTAELEREGVASFLRLLPGAARLYPD